MVTAEPTLAPGDSTSVRYGAFGIPTGVAALAALKPFSGPSHGSKIGGLPETQEMLDFCATHSIVPDVEVIPSQQMNDAWATLAKGGTLHRFVIDMKSLELTE